MTVPSGSARRTVAPVAVGTSGLTQTGTRTANGRAGNRTLNIVALLAPVFIVLVDLTRLVTVAGQSLTAFATGGLAVALTGTAAASIVRGSGGRGTPFGLQLWMLWSLACLTWGTTTLGGLQSLLVWVCFVGAIVTVSRTFTLAHVPSFARWMTMACWVFLVGNGIQVLVLQSDLFYGTRTAALVAVLAIAWMSSADRRQSLPLHYLPPFLLLVEVAVSGSRTALAVGFGIVALSSISRSGRSGSALAFFAIGGFAFVWLASTWAPLHDRFVQGDRGLLVAGVTLNTEGRAAIWTHLIEAWQLHPWIGQGLGSAQEITVRTTGVIDQPHNDFFRLLVDQGSIGALLFLAGVSALSFRHLRLAARDAGQRRLHVAALASIAGVLGTMLTDNPLVYVFVLVPAGVVIGASLAVGRQLPAEVLARPVRVDPLAVAGFCLVVSAAVAALLVLL